MNHRNHRRIRTGTPTGNFAPDAKLRSSSSSKRYAIAPGPARSESPQAFRSSGVQSCSAKSDCRQSKHILWAIVKRGCLGYLHAGGSRNGKVGVQAPSPARYLIWIDR
jgi:hypothetical protein